MPQSDAVTAGPDLADPSLWYWYWYWNEKLIAKSCAVEVALSNTGGNPFSRLVNFVLSSSVLGIRCINSIASIDQKFRLGRFE